jgi:serine/threonine-protein kinase
VIESFLAQGGCGSVYRARHRTTAGLAAIKVLHDPLVKAPKMVERFVREVEVVRRLHHPCIVEIHALGELPGGRPYYVMEYLEGMTLENLLHAQGRLSPAYATDLLGPVCLALEAAHAAGVVHRDIKASNVFVASDGSLTRVKLLDFGIAKLIDDRDGAQALTTAGRPIGTLSTMAPEQIRCGAIDHRVDIYALGVLVYKLLTGGAPFQSRTFSDLVRQHLEEPPPRPSLRAALPPGLDEVVLRCLEKRPELRFSSAKDFHAALRAVVGPEARAAFKSSPQLSVATIAVQVHIELRTTSEELGDDLAEELGRLLDHADARLQHAGFVVGLTAGMTILAVRSIHEIVDTGRARAAALELAWSLYEELTPCPGADDRVDITLGIRADEAVVRATSTPEIVGGAIASSWSLPAGASGLWVKPEILDGISGYETKAAPEGWVSILRPSP